MPITQSSTPQPSRAERNAIRNSWENEVWDDLSNVVYGTTEPTLTVPMPVAGRIQVWAAATVTITCDGVAFAGGASTVAWFDVQAGLHEITAAGVIVTARRGRTPSI